MRRTFLLALVISLVFGLTWPVRAQSGIEVSDVKIQYEFGRQITFQARIVSATPIQQVFVAFQQDGEKSARIFPMKLNQSGQVAYTHDVLQNTLKPFARIAFWYEAHLENGQTVNSSSYLFRYADNRFDWQSTGDGAIKIHWYEGDSAFGQAALDAANAGMSTANQVVPLAQSSSVDIYIYASTADLQSALVLGGETWQAGHASPELGVVMVAIPPSPTQALLMDQLIPHELAHVVLYKGLGEKYVNLPVWFSEGTATLAERFPNPDYERALLLASQEGTLLPIQDLCETFPPDQARAFLAYAESASFTRYLRDQHGNVGLSALAIAYTDELDCERGALRALGVPLSKLERDWREDVLGENMAGVAARNLLPYFLVLAVLLVLPLTGLLKFLSRMMHYGTK